MNAFLMILSYILVMYISYEIIRRSTWIVFGVFIVAPVVSIPIWLSGVSDWFIIAKTYTAVLYLLWTQATRSLQKLNKSKVMLGGIYLLLVINILEAVYRDIQTGGYVNAAAGVLLCIAIPTIKEISIDKIGKFNDLHWNMSKLWIVAYTIWNIAFVLGNFPHAFGMHIVVLGVPLVLGMINPKIWMQVRIITLTTHMMIRIFFSAFNESMHLLWMADLALFSPLLITLQVVSLLLSIACIVVMADNIRKKVRVEYN
ncbi:MAG: hypothetical protein COA82_03895 [Alkaliphilus sp.]|nr:hypothetical protein [bacterium AH-315-G05]PHS35585.1 MAG: hypothetical protein COA82_03895 [Alkaliphilus sp.]